MAHVKFQVTVDSQVYLDEGGEEIGSVREVGHDYIVVYVEGAGDFVVKGPEVRAAHDGKLLLDRDKLDPKLLAAALHAHERENS